MPLHIDEMYAFIADDEEGEGVSAFMGPHGWMPMVAADKERVEQLRPMAEAIANDTNTPIKLVRFSVREELETFTPTTVQ